MLSPEIVRPLQLIEHTHEHRPTLLLYQRRRVQKPTPASSRARAHTYTHTHSHTGTHAHTPACGLARALKPQIPLGNSHRRRSRCCFYTIYYFPKHFGEEMYSFQLSSQSRSLFCFALQIHRLGENQV